ncbi:MAG TPA: hypothetical protein VJH24_02020 [Candidatus Bilamarchaeaceae archaeon]|nr:hypothetical protein [Candidatus Bilamarchaeaceae archaeon]
MQRLRIAALAIAGASCARMPPKIMKPPMVERCEGQGVLLPPQIPQRILIDGRLVAVAMAYRLPNDPDMYLFGLQFSDGGSVSIPLSPGSNFFVVTDPNQQMVGIVVCSDSNRYLIHAMQIPSSGSPVEIQPVSKDSI